jgi:aspartate carbamoyltransferase catalytic subunit
MNQLNNDLNSLPELAIFRQSENGIPIRMALFALVLGVEDKVDQYSEKSRWFIPEKRGDHSN